MKRIVLLTLATALSWTASGAAQSKEELAQASATYSAQCIKCHQPPDLGLKTDLAWLDQVNRTG